MRISGPWFWALILSVAVISGCGKSGKQAEILSDPNLIDASQFRPAFASAPPETQTLVNQVMLSISSSDYVGALSQLETLTNTPGLTEPQQKVAANLTGQLTRKLASTPPPSQ